VRNLVVYEALNQLSVEASERLAGLVSEGVEIPFDLVEEPGPGGLLYRYEALTEAFVRSHAEQLRELPSFGPATAALDSAGFAPAYLAALDVARPADPRRQCEEAILAFLGRLWEGSTDFGLEGDRFETAIRELENLASEEADAVEVVVPLIGLQMPVQRIDLPGGVALIKSDIVDVPAEARRPEGSATTPWEPQILGLVRGWEGVGDGPGAVSAGRVALRRLLTTLRLLKQGSVGLGPHAWTRAGRGPWRRLATGFPRPRGGGYWLTQEDVDELTAFAAAVAARPVRGGSMSWAVGRFEMGLERGTPLEGLSDHLLGLRGILEGGGPAAIGLSTRVAALCAEPEGRQTVQAQVDRAFAIEQMLMRGYSVDVEDGGGEMADALAGEIENLLRAILRDALSGHLGTELRATADEILMADGISVDTAGEIPAAEVAVPVSSGEALADPAAATAPDDEDDWLSEEASFHHHTLEWPAREAVAEPAGQAAEREERPRPSRHLFPVPDATDWEVPEAPRRARRPVIEDPVTGEEPIIKVERIPAEAEVYPVPETSDGDEWDDYSAPV
jgi:hypothetical protein